MQQAENQQQRTPTHANAGQAPTKEAGRAAVNTTRRSPGVCTGKPGFTRARPGCFHHRTRATRAGPGALFSSTRDDPGRAGFSKKQSPARFFRAGPGQGPALFLPLGRGARGEGKSTQHPGITPETRSPHRRRAAIQKKHTRRETLASRRTTGATHRSQPQPTSRGGCGPRRHSRWATALSAP